MHLPHVRHFMIAVKCQYCGHEIEVSEAEQERGFPCSNCGHMLTKSQTPAASSHPTPSASSSNDPTLAGPALSPSMMTTGFAFLSPPTGPGELGWMAHYQVMRLLGQGGMGVVFEAVDTRLMRPVALKVMKPELAQDDLAKQRFLREARATAKLKSDHVVTIHDVNQHNDVPFLAMEFLQGESLDTWLLRRGRPSIEEAIRIGIDIARGLAAAHTLGLIHRDIKPSNIWLERSHGTGVGRAKILDFGLARVEDSGGNLTSTGVILGTPAYMAPEQAEHGRVDARSDLFSLGCILYELTTGQQAFTGPNTMGILMAVATKDPMPPHPLYQDVPPALSALVMHLLAKNPSDRPVSAEEVVASLEMIAAESGIRHATPASGIRSMTYKPPRRSSSRRTLWAGLGGILVLAALSAGIGGWMVFNAASRATAPGVTNREILLGMTGPFSGSSAELGRDMEIGLDTCFEAINEQGGVHGRHIRLVSLDDKYDPDKALANMIELRQDRGVFAVVGNVGTPTAAKTLPYAIENKLLFFGGFSGANLLRNVPPDRYVFNYRASYEEETEQIVRYLMKKRGIRSEEIAVFAQQDGYGDDGFRGVVKAIDRPAEQILRVGYERNTLQVQDAVDTIAKKPEIRAVVMVATYKPAARFIQKLKDANAKRDLIFTNVSFVGSLALAEELRERGDYAEGVLVTQVVPPIDSSATAVLKYRAALKKYHPNAVHSFVSLEGYLAGLLLVEGLKKSGDNLTTERLVDSLESLKDVDLGTGATLTFGPSRHQASHKVWGTRLDRTGAYKVLDME